MATTINVNGQTITIQDKKSIVASKSSESAIEYIDEFDALAKATESAVMADVYTNTLMNYAESQAAKLSSSFLKSSEADNIEAVGKSTQNVVGKIAAGAQKVWDAIINFFDKIATYVWTFINGKVIKARATALLAKLNATRNLTTSATKFKDISKYVANSKKLDSLISDISKMGIDKKSTDRITAYRSQLDALKNSEGGEAGVPVESVLKAICGGKNVGNVEAWLKGITSGSNDVMQQLKAAHESAKKNKAEALANKKSGNDPNVIKKFNLLTQAQNAQVRQKIAIINTGLKACSAVIGGKTEDNK